MELISKRIAYIRPRYKIFKDWYKLVFPLNRIPGEKKLHLKTDMEFTVRGARTSDVSILIDLLFKNEYPALNKIAFKQSHKIVVDLGANIGAFIALVNSTLPDAEVHAYEANPVNFEILKKNLRKGDRAYFGAVTDHPGESVLYLNDFSVTSTLRKENVVNVSSDNSVKVPNIVFKDILSSFEHIDLVKVDIESAEFEIFFSPIEGLIDRVENIFLEIHGHSKWSTEDLIARIESLGFRKAPDGACVASTYWFQRK